MPAPWKPNQQLSSCSPTPEVPKSWTSGTFPDDDFCNDVHSTEAETTSSGAIAATVAAGQNEERVATQGEDSSVDMVDKFLAGLAPGDPGYEQAEPERLSQTHFLHHSGSFDWGQGEAGVSQKTLQKVMPVSQEPPSQVTLEATQADSGTATATLEMAGVAAALSEPLLCTQISDELPSTQVGEDATLCAEQFVQQCDDVLATQLYAPSAQRCEDGPAAQICADALSATAGHACDDVRPCADVPATQLYPHSCDDVPSADFCWNSSSSQPCCNDVPSTQRNGEAAATVVTTQVETATVTPVRPPRCFRKSDSSSGAKGRKGIALPSPEKLSTTTTLGHTLQPPQQGLRIAVVGDGWGSCEGGYEAVVTEADHYTFTVISTSGKDPWTESHVLKEHCIFLAEESSTLKSPKTCVSKRQRRG